MATVVRLDRDGVNNQEYPHCARHRSEFHSIAGSRQAVAPAGCRWITRTRQLLP
jgi:hypothetical protein